MLQSIASLVSREIYHHSAAMAKNITASLLGWQNAESQNLCTIPPAIPVDLKAIATRSAAWVIAGFPFFDEAIITKPYATAKTGLPPAPTTTSSYANMVKKACFLQNNSTGSRKKLYPE